MLSCNGCIHRNSSQCGECVGWDRYESNTISNPILAVDIDREMRMLAKAGLNKIFGVESVKRKIDMRIEKVIFNYPATVVIWKAGDHDVFDPEKGLVMASAKKALGNRGNYYEVFKKWLPEEKEEEELSALDELKQALANLTIPKLPIATDVKVTEKDDGVEITGKPVTLLTAEEFAEKSGVTKATIQKRCRQGVYPGAVKVGDKWKIPC